MGLITLDTYRVGAHEQLRSYGRMLGVVAHLAHDRAALQDLLGLLAGKKMVLIDTTGVAPRDPRKRDMLDVLDLPNVNRLLVLNASSHGDTLDDVLTAFKTSGAQQAILSKVDEAVKLGPALDAQEAVRWLMEVLERNLRTDAQTQPLYEQGGIYAMVGATGVGKTTTAAKLAAHCARIHGPGSVGLITLDTYRVGAHEQLRSYGRMLGVVAHLAHDRAALQDLLGLLAGKKMVLIDTTGVAPRDPRKRELLDVLDLPEVQRLLVLNASSHGDTLDDVLTAFKTTGAQQAILSKVDEAVKLGPALDALIRHQLELRGVTNGQRVPEDWEAADAHKLIATSMRSKVSSAFDPKVGELNFFFSPATETAHDQGLAHVA